MSSKNKAQLRSENNASFPNNNTGFITPDKLRTFNENIIDSMVSNEDSGSFLAGSTGSLLQTASFDNGTRLMTFTKGDASTFDVSIPDALPSTASLLVTASVSDADITFTKGDASTFSILVNNVSSSISASHAEFADLATQAEDLYVTVKNTSGSPISKGLAVHATGVTGENINVILADSSDSNAMPAIGLLEETLANNATGRAIIAGRLKNVDTSGLVAGASVYVNGAGILTSNEPTGSDEIQSIGVAGKINATDGEIVVLGAGRVNAIPNIQNGYGWFGNSDGVGEAQTTASFAKTDINNTFTGTQNFNNISVSGTGSFGYIEAVTGSAKIIGDAFIILNNNTPSERYAGIKVQDSGSNTTASLQWDGGTNDWFYEYSASATHEYGVSLFGPEYTTKGTPTYNTNNTITKGTGGHHLVDSNITDDGSTITLGSDIAVTGNITGNNTFTGINTFTGGAQIVSGSNGFITQTFEAPGTNVEKALINVTGANINSTAYNRVFFGMADYPSFGDAYKDYFAIEYYNGLSYSYGSEFSINGLVSTMTTLPNGGGAANAAMFRTKDDGDSTSTAEVRGNTIDVGVESTNTVIRFGRAGSTQMALRGTDVFFNSSNNEFANQVVTKGNLIVSASVITDLETLSISSQTASVDFNTAQTKVLTLVSGSDTHIDFTNQNIGQTVILKIKQPASGPGTIVFSPDAKQPDGLHYSASQAADAIDVLTLQTLENDGNVFIVSAKKFN